MSMTDFVGLVLAGGASSRMGTDKAALVLENRSLLDRSKHLLSSVCDNNVIIAGTPHSDINEPTPFLGPANAIVQSVQQHHLYQHYRYLVVIPVDMRLLKPQLIQPLQQHALRDQNSVYFDHCYLPCVINLHQLARVCAHQEAAFWHNMPMRKLLAYTHAQNISSKQWASALKNVNTPKEWNLLVG